MLVDEVEAGIEEAVSSVDAKRSRLSMDLVHSKGCPPSYSPRAPTTP